jgi:ribosomal protein S18 acetylase RimI-like enzyme
MMNSDAITYTNELTHVDWEAMKAILLEDNFDNGRTPQQLRISFENSFLYVIAYAGGRIIGTVRVLSDQVCNAYIVDVWTYSHFRCQGIASQMMRIALEKLPGQHVYLFTEDAEEFYATLGFKRRGVGLELVVGTWLVNTP